MCVRRVVLVAVLLLTPLAGGQTREGRHPWCGSGPAMADQQIRLQRWLASREKLQVAATEPGVRVVDGIYVVTADANILAFDHTFDLASSSLRVRRVDERTFEAVKVTPALDPDPGTFVHEFPAGDSTPFAADLRSFAFPFGTGRFSRLYLTGSNAIVTTPEPTIPSVAQWHALEAVASQRAMISPLFHPTPVGKRRLFLKQTDDELLVTWTGLDPSRGMAYRVQARLDARGDIVFSYGLLDNVEWGTAIVTTGEEALYSNRATIASGTDPANDVASGIRTQWRDILDVTSVEVRRLGDSDLFEFVLQLRSEIDPSKFAADDYFLYAIRFSNGAELDLLVGRDTTYYFVPGRGSSTAARVDGKTITMRVVRSFIPSGLQNILALAYDYPDSVSEPVFADVLSFSTTIPAAAATLESNLSELTQPAQTSKPVFEAFTLPSLGLYAVYNKVLRASELTNETIDGLAVYENFNTNILFGDISAYALTGNAGADGVGHPSRVQGYGRSQPLYPTLMDMNRIGYQYNIDNRYAGFVLAHEFAHRWLYYLAISENGAASNVLNPVSPHPAQYVHTASAHPVASSRDSSMMGGANFSALGSGSFETGPPGTNDGYSAHELYLMGLASPEEVEPWFYLDGTTPALGPAYWAPAEIRVQGTQRDVRVQQIIDALGPRLPVYDGTARSFRVLYAIVERPGAPVTENEVGLVSGYIAAFERRFAVATGFRGTIAPPVADTPLAASFEPSVTTLAAQQRLWFVDRSRGNVRQWKWTFGDGTTASWANPAHVFRTPGTYTVTLEVSDGTSSSTASRTFTVLPNRRRRSSLP